MNRSALHASFTIERIYPAPRDKVFAAFSDPTLKRQWAYGADENAHSIEFRVGGREHVEMPGPGGGTFSYEGIYFDIVSGERIVLTYSFAFGPAPSGVTLATFEFADAENGGTHLKLTEQGAYLDGFDGPKFWQSGTTSLLDRLGKLLEA